MTSITARISLNLGRTGGHRPPLQSEHFLPLGKPPPQQVHTSSVRFSFFDDNFTDYVPGELDKSIQRRFEQSFDIAMGAILRSILFRHRWTEAIGLDSFRAKLCHIRSTGRHSGKDSGARIYPFTDLFDHPI